MNHMLMLRHPQSSSSTTCRQGSLLSRLLGSPSIVHLHITIMLRRPLWTARTVLRSPLKPSTKRYFADKSTPPSATPTSRLNRIESRLPNFLRRYTVPLRNAPVSHITAFIILHEITAVVPLFGLTAAFHYTNWLPPYISEGKWISDYTEKFGRYLRRKKWISDESGSGRWWGRGEKGTRLVVEMATAYAITKVLLPARLLLSVWGTPWFARLTVLPVTKKLGTLFMRKKPVAVGSGNAAGTGAVGGGVVPRDGK
ncbi:uncharacterized protein RCC_07448 [Ramularia collo-cygni]|uniref:Uncharacterized protein n=1 Tax=Ramularia collo-cygni TaxID=112498 RepID=A0A2D3VFC4_9PEZI|nr:uncharacterized protein RCC_07448 [Ramularia collo-cygni]CZT21584.1 uncharacterized protein RCC_07448 [Ramularia collo-cygni]